MFKFSKYFYIIEYLFNTCNETQLIKDYFKK